MARYRHQPHFRNYGWNDWGRAAGQTGTSDPPAGFPSPLGTSFAFKTYIQLAYLCHHHWCGVHSIAFAWHFIRGRNLRIDGLDAGRLPSALLGTHDPLRNCRARISSTNYRDFLSIQFSCMAAESFNSPRRSHGHDAVAAKATISRRFLHVCAALEPHRYCRGGFRDTGACQKKMLCQPDCMWIILARVLPKANDYGYAGFLPAMVLIICHHIFLSTENRKLDTTFFNQPWLILLSGVATLYLLGFAKVVQQTIQQWNSPSTFAAAKASIAELTAGIGGRATAIAYPTMFTPSFVALAQPSGPRMIGSTWPESQPWGSLHPMDSFEKSQNIRIQYYLLPRKVTSLGQTPPPSIYLGRGKYTLISNQWAETGTAIPILSNLLKQYSQNYQFAVYRRIP